MIRRYTNRQFTYLLYHEKSGCTSLGHTNGKINLQLFFRRNSSAGFGQWARKVQSAYQKFAKANLRKPAEATCLKSRPEPETVNKQLIISNSQ